jgi:hypothetical protein
VTSTTRTARVPPASRVYWICQAAGWGLYVVVTVYELIAERVAHAVVLPFVAAALGIALTHGFRHFARARGWTSLGAGALAPRIVASSFGLAIVYVAVLGVVEHFAIAEASPSPVLAAVSAIVRWSMAFFIWLAIYFGYAVLEGRRDAEVRRLRAEKAAKDAELGSLRAQLNPHFLFNSLNSIRALVVDDPTGAQDAITRTARILRYTLESGHEPTVTLKRELEMVDDYLALESLRLQDRLRVERRIEEGARHVPIPIMLVQLLVENAVKHGVSQRVDGGTLVIVARRIDEGLEIVVENPRPDVPARPLGNESPGIGVANGTERLRLLFGEAATFDLDLSRPALATARVVIPIRDRGTEDTAP